MALGYLQFVTERDGWTIGQERSGRFVIVTPEGHWLAWLDTEEQAERYLSRRIAERGATS